MVDVAARWVTEHGLATLFTELVPGGDTRRRGGGGWREEGKLQPVPFYKGWSMQVGTFGGSIQAEKGWGRDTNDRRGAATLDEFDLGSRKPMRLPTSDLLVSAFRHHTLSTPD